MKKIDVSRALRDPEYRSRLSPAELSLVPEHPAGVSVLSDELLREISGGDRCRETATRHCSTCPGTGCDRHL